MPAIRLQDVTKIHPLRRSRAWSLKQRALNLFRKREEEEVVIASDSVSLDIEKGACLGVIGANGAGKSTLLKLIAGITEPTSGLVETTGSILPLLELGAGFHPDLSGYENVILQGSLVGLNRRQSLELLPDIVEFAGLEDFIHMPVRHYSTGMYVRLGFSISIHVDPDILLIDEVFSVGDLYFQKKCIERMLDFHRRGKTLVIVTHDIHLVEAVCDRVIWIEHGRVADDGPPATVAHHYKKTMFDRTYPAPAPLESEQQALMTREGRYGSGDVTFEYLDFVNDAGETTHTLLHGRPAEIRMRYHVHRPVEQMRVMIYIQSDRGHSSACLCTDELRKPVRPLEPGGELRFPIQRLDLTPGYYNVITMLCSGDIYQLADICDIHIRVGGFVVAETDDDAGDAPPSRLSPFAAVDPPGRWEWGPVETAGAARDT